MVLLSCKLYFLLDKSLGCAFFILERYAHVALAGLKKEDPIRKSSRRPIQKTQIGLLKEVNDEIFHRSF